MEQGKEKGKGEEGEEGLKKEEPSNDTGDSMYSVSLQRKIVCVHENTNKIRARGGREGRNRMRK